MVPQTVTCKLEARKANSVALSSNVKAQETGEPKGKSHSKSECPNESESVTQFSHV